MTAERFLFASSRRYWSEFCEFAKVLDGCCEEELILGAVWSSAAEAVEPDDTFEVGKEHFDLLSGVAGGDIGIGLRDIPCFLARVFMSGSGDLPGRLIRGTTELQEAPGAIFFAGEVAL